MKTPVIVNNLGALPELVEDSGGGIIYNNSNELCDAIENLVENPDLRNDLGAKGYATFLKLWSEKAHLMQYFDLIGNGKNKFEKIIKSTVSKVKFETE